MSEIAEPDTARQPAVSIRRVTASDIREALGEGLRDFQAAPTYGLFFGAIYAAGGVAVVAALTLFGAPWFVYPAVAGFALIGPFVAVGLYEVSRRREAGEPQSWTAVLGAIRRGGRSEIGWMAFVTLFVFIVWMYQVRLLLALFLGFQSFTTLREFLLTLVTTPEGLAFLAVGHVVGAFLALGLFSITVVSFPMLVDRDVDFITAMITSVRAVAANPGPMLGWGVVVTLTLIAACLPFFLGLVLALPILGHATWRLYRKLVAPLPFSGLSGSQA